MVEESGQDRSSELLEIRRSLADIRTRMEWPTSGVAVEYVAEHEFERVTCQLWDVERHVMSLADQASSHARHDFESAAAKRPAWQRWLDAKNRLCHAELRTNVSMRRDAKSDGGKDDEGTNAQFFRRSAGGRSSGIRQLGLDARGHRL